MSNTAKVNMISQQLRAWGVLNDDLLSIVDSIDRADFVPTNYQKLAYADTQIPLEHNQIMLEPKSQARMIQALALQADDQVLEIGTGTGYMTALLAKSAKKVVSVDIFDEFSQTASKNIEKYDLQNIELITEDATKPSASVLNQQYNAIVITGAVIEQPDYLLNSLTEGGRLVCIVGEAPAMAATLFVKENANLLKDNIIFETVIPFLINTPKNDKFQF